MTEPKLKADKEAGLLSEGAKTHVIDVMVSEKYQRREEVYSKFLEKGNEVEEDSITFLSLQKRAFYLKNETRLENDWIKGTPDLFVGEVIERATQIIDIKSSWDVFTFHRSMFKGLNQTYYWQMQGYMWLTGAESATISYCLVNATPDLITDEKYRCARAYRVSIDDQSPEFIKACQMIERNMIYDLPAFQKTYPAYNLHSDVTNWDYDIKSSERLFEVVVPRNNEDIERIKTKVEAAWLFINSLSLPI
jgi:hypothetical protein